MGFLMPTYIYALCCPVSGEIRYVGKTINLRTRLRAHLKAKNEKTHKQYWVNSVAAKGLVPIFEILEEIPSEIDWQESERFWISYLRFIGCRLTNSIAGGIGGLSPCAATREKQRAAKLGRKLSEEHKRNVGIAGMGRKLSAAHIAATSAGNRGKKRSEETRRKIGLKSKGRVFSKESRARMSASRIGKRDQPNRKKK